MASNNGVLSAKMQRFVDEYCIDFNATRAAIAAGYSARTAKDIGCENLAKPNIQKAISEKQKKVTKKLEITLERVLLERARIGFFDCRTLFNADGTPKAINELDDDTAAVIAGIDVVTSEDGSSRILKYKITDKSKSLEALEKNLGAYQKDNEQKASPITDLIAALHEQSKGLPSNGNA